MSDYKYFKNLTFVPEGKSWDIVLEGSGRSVGTAWISRWNGDEKWCADILGTFGIEGYAFDDLAQQVWEEVSS